MESVARSSGKLVKSLGKAGHDIESIKAPCFSVIDKMAAPQQLQFTYSCKNGAFHCTDSEVVIIVDLNEEQC